MSMNDGELPVAVTRQIDALCLEFEQAWRSQSRTAH